LRVELHEFNVKIMELPEEKIKISDWFKSEHQFNQLYPNQIQELSAQHWTPLSIAKKAADFLSAEKNTRVLDIGSGVGKFCLAAAYFQPSINFFGVEQRMNLVEHAESAKQILGLENVTFLNQNFTSIDFNLYDHFYFFNSFYENINDKNKIDENIEYSDDLFHYYSRFLYRQLDKKPSGTRIATYHSSETEVPKGYHIVGEDIDTTLKFWIKV